MRSIVAVVALVLLATPAFATDFTQVLTDGDGKPLCGVEVKDGEACTPDKLITLSRVARNALYASYPDEQNLPGDEKYKRAELAQALVGTPDVKLKAEDVALIKKLVAKMYGPIVVYNVWQILDPK